MNENADNRVFVVGELNVTDPDRRLLVVSVPKDIAWDKKDGRIAALVVAVAEAMERREDA